jgi:hypothetical protein
MNPTYCVAGLLVAEGYAERSKAGGIRFFPDALQRFAPRGTTLADEAGKARARQEAGRSIHELRTGNILGPDLTMRDLVEEGRRF